MLQLLSCSFFSEQCSVSIAKTERLGKMGKGWEKTALLTVSICWEWTFGEDRKRVKKDWITDYWEWTFEEDRKGMRKDWITDREYLLRVNIWGRQEKDKSRLEYRPLKMQETDTAEIHFSKQKDGWQWVTSHTGQGWRMAAHSEDNAWSILHGYIAKRNSNGTDWLKHLNLIVEAILSLVGWK